MPRADLAQTPSRPDPGVVILVLGIGIELNNRLGVPQPGRGGRSVGPDGDHLLAVRIDLLKQGHDFFRVDVAQGLGGGEPDAGVRVGECPAKGSEHTGTAELSQGPDRGDFEWAGPGGRQPLQVRQGLRLPEFPQRLGRSGGRTETSLSESKVMSAAEVPGTLRVPTAWAACIRTVASLCVSSGARSSLRAGDFRTVAAAAKCPAR